MSSTPAPPRARPAAAPVAIVVALLLVALAVVSVRDLVVSEGWAQGTPWSLSLVRSLDGLTPSVVTVVVAVAFGVLGLLLVLAALKPARKTHLRGPGETDLWITAPAVAALARGIADRVPGVVEASTGKVSRRKIRIDVVTAKDSATIRQQVESAIGARLDGLTSTTIAVKMKEVSR